jgi:hypothetical protein
LATSCYWQKTSATSLPTPACAGNANKLDKTARLTKDTGRGSGPPGGLTEVGMEASGAGADRQQQILQFMTTEHFTLQTTSSVFWSGMPSSIPCFTMVTVGAEAPEGGGARGAAGP